MSKYKHKPKGQQSVDVEKLNKHKRDHEKYMAENNPQKTREWHFRSIVERGEHKFNNRKSFWEFLENWSRNMDWYHQVLTQPERNLLKMAPFGCDWAIGPGFRGSTNPSPRETSFIDGKIDGKTLVLMKNSKRRTDCFTADEWRDIIWTISLMRRLSVDPDDTLNKVMFCRKIITDEQMDREEKGMQRMIDEGDVNWRAYNRFFDGKGFSREILYNKYVPKLYEKEKQAIIAAGCEFVEEITFEGGHRFGYRDDYKYETLNGWLFKLPDISHFDVPEEYRPKSLTYLKSSLVQKIKDYFKL